ATDCHIKVCFRLPPLFCTTVISPPCGNQCERSQLPPVNKHWYASACPPEQGSPHAEHRHSAPEVVKNREKAWSGFSNERRDHTRNWELKVFWRQWQLGRVWLLVPTVHHHPPVSDF